MNNDNTVDLLQIKIERAKEKLPAETQNAIAAVDWRSVIMGLRDKKGYNFEQLGDLELETELLLCGLASSAEYPKELQRRMGISKAETDVLVNEMNTLVFKKIKEELIKNTERKKIFQKSNSPLEEYPLGGGGQTLPPRSDPGRSTPQEGNKGDMQIMKSAGIEMLKPELELPAPNKPLEENREELLKKIENPTPLGTRVVEPMLGEAKTPQMSTGHSLLQQKILGSIQMPVTKTEHTMENITKENVPIAKAPEAMPTSGYASKKDPYRMAPDE